MRCFDVFFNFISKKKFYNIASQNIFCRFLKKFVIESTKYNLKFMKILQQKIQQKGNKITNEKKSYFEKRNSKKRNFNYEQKGKPRLLK